MIALARSVHLINKCSPLAQANNFANVVDRSARSSGTLNVRTTNQTMHYFALALQATILNRSNMTYPTRAVIVLPEQGPTSYSLDSCERQQFLPRPCFPSS